jgi:hypothetical protein
VDALWPYYQTLIDKYIPGTLKWWIKTVVVLYKW